MAKKGGHRTKSKPGSGSKIKKYKRGRDTKRRRRDVEQVFDDMTKKEQLETAQPFDDDLPGCGQFYCVETARYFVDQKALDDHKKSRAYKRRVKELKEETGVEGTNPISLAVHGEPTRDPRKHVIALFYLVDVDPESIPTAGDDASEAYWVPLDAVTENEIAGDHIFIIDKLRE